MSTALTEQIASVEPFPGLETIAPGMYFSESYDPALKNKSEDDTNQGPSLIVLCTWLGGATVRRIQKYLTIYHDMFPTSAVLLIRTKFIDVSFRSFKSYRARLAPAREVIKHVMEHCNGQILLQAFSHGGCNTAVQLALSMREEQIKFPVRGVIFDCCPGDSAFSRMYHASVLSLPTNPVASLIGSVAILPVIATVSTLQVNGLIHSVEDLRRDMNDSQVFGSGVRRLYLYSVADEAVRWQDVESHMADARSQGWKVQGVKFERSAHCAIIMDHETHYCQAIKHFWQDREDLHDTQEISPARLRSKI